MTEFENTLAGDDFADPVNGYAKYIDVDSFVDFFLINEATKNVDGLRLSTFFYKQRDSDGGKLVMGPIWDFNLGFGNADYCTEGNPQGFVLDFNSICSGDDWLIPFWWERLFEDEVFSERVAQRWNELRAGVFDTDRITTYIDSVSSVLDESQQRNFQRWPVLNEYVWPNYFVGATYQEEVNWLKNWVVQRMDWLDLAIAGIVTNTGDEMANDRLTVLQNPFEKNLKLQYNLERAGHVSVELFDIMGNKIRSFDQGRQSPGDHIIEADMGDMPTGLYIYQYRNDNARPLVGKVIKK
jgi:hypothetical protein